MSDALACPHCAQPMFKATGDGRKLKARTSMLVLHKGGSVEINCGVCGKGVIIPLELRAGPVELRKAVEPRLVIPKA